jgi:hypothetical protein
MGLHGSSREGLVIADQALGASAGFWRLRPV